MRIQNRVSTEEFASVYSYHVIVLTLTSITRGLNGTAKMSTRMSCQRKNLSFALTPNMGDFNGVIEPSIKVLWDSLSSVSHIYFCRGSETIGNNIHPRKKNIFISRYIVLKTKQSSKFYLEKGVE